MLALDVARIEAGLLLIDVDFHSSRKAMIESQKYSPFELGLARLVDLDKGPFVGRAGARRRASPRPAPADRRPRSRLDRGRAAVRSRRPAADRAGGRLARRGAGLQGRPPGRPRDVDDVVDDAEEADRAGDDRRAALRVGTRLELEITVEAVRHTATATVVKTPFFNPPRKTATPPL